MKKITFLFILYFTIHLSFSQGTSISTAEQFCSGTSQLTFNNVFGGTSSSPLGCLGSYPNPSYFFMEIDQPGDLIFTIAQENTAGIPIDVDFIAWGPFTDLADANANITYTNCPTCPNNTTDPTFYPYAPDFITDCSFDASPTETMNILNAMQGEIYVVLITNYNGAQGTIDFQQTGGTGTTTCASVPVCGSQFFDSGGSTGPYSGNETTTINPYFAGGTVTVDFTTVNIPDAGDILTVYNGPNNTFPVLGTVTATGSFTSNTTGNPTGAITFELITDGDANVGTGWVADITCTPPPTPPTCGFTFYDSGGAGGNYGPNELQTYTFYPDTAGDVVTATFTAFDLESCCDDLTVYNGPNTTYPSLGTYAGTGIPGPFTSTDPSGALTFVFDSDSSIQNSGWAADLSCSTPICGSTFYDSGGSGGNYGANESQTTTFFPDSAGDLVTATFTAFNTESGNDELNVYDGPNATFPLLGTFSGTTIPGPFTASDPSGALTFVFTSDGSNQNSGWAVDLTCSSSTFTCGSIFYDSGGAGGNYSPNELQTTTFYPDTPGDAITATFTNFDTESGWDELFVYDGPDATYPLLGIFSGTALPGPFTSSDATGALTFVFDSDSSFQYGGWAANLSCAPYVPPAVCGTTFYDSGGAGGNYSASEFSTTTLIPDVPGTSVTVTFTAFDLEPCCDELLVYDGPDATYPLLGTFAGTTLPGPFTSTDPSGALTFVFDSDSSIQYSGWAADVTCASNCSLTVTDTVYPIGADSCNLDYTELVANTTVSSTRTTVYNETFDGAAFPAGWVIVNGAASADWIIATTSEAGGAANEAQLDWISGSHNSTWRITSPSVDITGFTNLELGFRQSLDLFGSGAGLSVYAETSTDGTTWTPQYSAINPPNSFDSTETIDISALDGNTTLYIRFRLSGNTSPLFDWSIDNVTITADGIPMTPQVTWSPTTGLYTDSAMTTAYTGGFATTVYAAPNGIQTYTATENSCTDTATVTHNKKIWNGSDIADGTNWYVANNWTPAGVPSINSCVVIPDNATVPNNPTADKSQVPIPLPPQPATARNLTLETNAYLEIETDTELIVQEWVDVQNTGIFNLKSSSSLIQIDDSAVNSGEIHMQRSPNFDESAVAASEYVYWSSPVANFQVTDISPTSGLMFYWTPSVIGNGTGNHGEWFAATGTMNDGTGYIVRGLGGTPTNIPATAYPVSPNTALFSGVPNNGVVTKSLTHGGWNGGTYAGIGNTATNEDDNWNLIGNPYPSAISANAFTNLNTNINGTVYVWPHNSTYSAVNLDPFYEDYVYNYDGNDYIEHNNTGSNPPGTSDLFIGSGQAFFVLMNHTATSGSNVTFNNSMRQVLPAYNNNTFFRTNGNEDSNNTIERHRIWLDLLSPNNVTNTILVGYIDNATNTFDRLYDGYDFSSGDSSGFYSVLDDDNLSIQGRALPFLQEDTVPLGVIANETGSHTIAINTIDGLFLNEEQNIYIEDTELDIIHDIRNAPYTFSITQGIHNNRFILRYTNETLSVNPVEDNNGISIAAPQSEYIKVTSEIGVIKTVDVYDIVGRLIFKSDDINESNFILNKIRLSAGSYIVTATLINGNQKTQKVVIKQ
ncbi:CUB domain-containing protein [uncultured Psychroserpens sp.]|uniref:CUB domain-containing protein n=1 Tax=uncultured Psychroserpens sp. TaxID=255436 RepID=UPI00261FCF2E|nr:CUB domain-containing protein [uncultured Psychroserpens sp.]